MAHRSALFLPHSTVVHPVSDPLLGNSLVSLHHTDCCFSSVPGLALQLLHLLLPKDAILQSARHKGKRVSLKLSKGGFLPVEEASVSIYTASHLREREKKKKKQLLLFSPPFAISAISR